MQYRMAWPPLTDNIKITLIGLAVLFLLTVVSPTLFEAVVWPYMIVSKDAVVEHFQIWTIVSYSLWHATFSHLLFNGLALWMFGGHADRRWTDKKFWRYSALCATGGGAAVVLTQLVTGYSVPTLGYSAVAMGFAAAFCWQFWNRKIYFLFFPMTGKQLLLLFVGFDLLLVLGSNKPISVSGHMGGLLTGLVILGKYWKPRYLKRLMRRTFK